MLNMTCRLISSVEIVRKSSIYVARCRSRSGVGWFAVKTPTNTRYRHDVPRGPSRIRERSATSATENPTLRDFLVSASNEAHGESSCSSSISSSSSHSSSGLSGNISSGITSNSLITDHRSNDSAMSDFPATGWDDSNLVSTPDGKASHPNLAQKGCNVTFLIETYGCQMNVSDSEVVRAILLKAGFQEATSLEEAEVVLANTCAIRERAEGKVWDRLKYFSSIR